MRINHWMSLAAAAALVPFVAGCSNDSGANNRPTVTVKPKAGDEPAPSSTPAAGGETAPAGGAAPAATGSGPGNLKGVVTVKGDVPEVKLLVRKGDTSAKDAAICAAEDVPDESLVVGSNNGLANVFIYLPKAPSGAEVAAAPSEAVKFDQKHCQFIPHALVVRTGQTVKVLNSDGVAHNTHTYPLQNQAFNSLVAPNDQEGVPMTYQAAEKLPVAIKCDIHPWMIAYQLPLDHSFAAVTDKDGNFEIANLPAGEHEFVVWHEKTGYLERKYKVTITAGQTQEVKLEFGDEDLLAAPGPGHLKTINISALTR